MRLINFIRRVCLMFVIRSLEIHLADQCAMLRTELTAEGFAKVLTAKTHTQDDLAKARKEYSALMKPGQRRTWKTA